MQQFSARYPVWFCDIWGVVHDGMRPNPVTVDTLLRHRGAGGTVILITNAPRPAETIRAHLEGMGCDAGISDAIVTSGDVTRSLVRPYAGRGIFHLGPPHNLTLLEGIDVARVPLAEAAAILCTGLLDDRHETPENYRDLLAEASSRKLPMICANPDHVVRHGHRLLYCAGSLAAAYEEVGGPVLMAGKPYPPIYAEALARASAARGETVARDRILAIGDGPQTDIRGAADFGIAALLVADGIADRNADPAALEAEAYRLVPHARIVATRRSLDWVGA